MPLNAGTRLGPYAIEAPIGTGGMGEVYRAKDTPLDRTVAIKVLPAHVTADPQFRQRFEREAKTISQLNHPHICTLYDVGEAAPTSPELRVPSPDSVSYLVMEYLDGETLAQKLAGSRLRASGSGLLLDEAVGYGIQIADALDKAHRQGIVHRDLKPGNIMITKAGAKLLDFGLAKTSAVARAFQAREADPRGLPYAAPDLTAPPTVTTPLTAQGTILGTFPVHGPRYMAPEQLEGKEADARTDIWAFGCVLYEMLTGSKAFDSSTQASLIAAILERDAPPITMRKLAPAALIAWWACVSRKTLRIDGRARAT